MNNSPTPVKLIECPRDAMQGWSHYIETKDKIAYINSLLNIGFDTIDFGSFVSPKAIPQMRDTKEVLEKLNVDTVPNATKLLAIVANVRGAEEAVIYDKIHYLGYPFSISETFQLKNTNSHIKDAYKQVEHIQTLCIKHQKKLVVYISMGFGNPYGDAYDEEIVYHWAKALHQLDVNIISLADTVGMATSEQVRSITGYLINALPTTEIGVHLHATPQGWKEKVEAALFAGCTRFDGALLGIGGCPMAGNELVGNLNTENLINFFAEKGSLPPIQVNHLETSIRMAKSLFQ